MLYIVRAEVKPENGTASNLSRYTLHVVVVAIMFRFILFFLYLISSPSTVCHEHTVVRTDHAAFSRLSISNVSLAAATTASALTTQRERLALLYGEF
jgi:hypothetical protein